MLAGEGVFASAPGVVAEVVGGASRRIKSGEDIATGFLVWFGYSVVSWVPRDAAEPQCAGAWTMRAVLSLIRHYI